MKNKSLTKMVTNSKNNNNILGYAKQKWMDSNDNAALPEILFITSYPSRECGIATYSSDLINAIKEKFQHTFSIKICALEGEATIYNYPAEVGYILNTLELDEYYKMAHFINVSENIKTVFIQHEFGLFGGHHGEFLLELLSIINKPVITTFHTILPNPDDHLKKIVQTIIELSATIIVMTNNSAAILQMIITYQMIKLRLSHTERI